MKHLPITLIYSRIVLGIVIVALAITQPSHYHSWIITLIVTGLLADIFDGIIARRLGISSEKLRRLDSTIDQLFWLSVLVASFIIARKFYIDYLPYILLLLAFEAICYAVSYIKFRREVATHAIASKAWTLSLLAVFIQLIACGYATTLFWICFYLGMLTRLEIIAMLLLIRQWTNDIPTVYHAYLLRHNRPVKRHKLFNG